MNQSMRDEAARAIDHDRVMWQAGYAAGLQDGCQHNHRAIADSVAEMFPGWDGARAAHLRSVARFRDETRRKDLAA